MITIDESLVLAISFLIFCFVFLPPIYKAVAKILDEKISKISSSFSEALSRREYLFKMLRKAKRVLSNATHESDLYLKNLRKNNEILGDKAYSEYFTACEKKNKNTVLQLQNSGNQQITDLYHDMLSKSASCVEYYIYNHRKSFPKDIEIAKKLLDTSTSK